MGVRRRSTRTGASGLVTNVIEVPGSERQRLSLSGVTLTSLPSVLMPTRGKVWLETSLGMPPSAARTFVAGDQITAAVEVYAPESARAGAVSVAELDIPGSGSLRIAGLGRSGGQARSCEIAFSAEYAEIPNLQRDTLRHLTLDIPALVCGPIEP
jgi:hypothetical protein